MKKTMIAALVLLLAAASFATAGTLSKTDLVSGGVLCETNAVKARALELVHVMYSLPTADLTNTFTITQERRYMPPPTVDTIITTSTVFLANSGSYLIETNYYSRQSVAVDATNVFTVAVETNSTAFTTYVYDEDVLPMYWIQEWNDVFTFRFTETNDFTLIRVYDIHTRP